MESGKSEDMLLIAFCTLLIIPILYIGRFADDNTFTSWKWVFTSKIMLRVFLMLIPAVMLSYVLSGREYTSRTAAAIVFFLPAFAVLPLWSAPESIIDAGRYFIQSATMRRFGTGYFIGEWGNAIQAWTDLPLVPFLNGLIFSLIGESRAAIQLFNTLLFASTSLLTMLIGKRIWDGETGMHAGVMLVGIPYLLAQVPLMLTDVPTMFFLTLSIYVFIKVIDHGGVPWTAASALSIVAAMLAKYSAWPMLAVLPLTAVCLGKKKPSRVFPRTAIVFLTAGVIAGCFVALRYDLIRDQMSLLTTYQLSGLSRWKESLVSTFLYQTHPFIGLFAIIGIYRAVRERDLRFLIPAWFVVFAVALQLKRMRYLIPLLPLFTLMAAYGLNLIADRRIKRFIVLCAVASSLVLTYNGYLPYLKSSGMANIKNAGEYLNTLDGDYVDIYALEQSSSSGSTFAAIPLLDYATGKHLVSPRQWPSKITRESRTSSMRFTWEMKRPEIYARGGSEPNRIFAVISSDPLPAAPDDLTGSEISRFDIISPAFKYQTIVTIYKRE